MFDFRHSHCLQEPAAWLFKNNFEEQALQQAFKEKQGGRTEK